MKKIALLAAIAAIVLAPHVGRAITGLVDVQGRIAPPLRITPVAALDFGTLLTDGINTGTSVVDTAGAETLTNLIQLTAPSNGSFDLSGRGGATVNTLGISASTTLNCGVDTDPVNDCTVGATTLTVDTTTLDQTAPVVLPAGPGLQTLSVNYGGTMHTAINQAAGLYTGTLTVTAAY
jgi:hypothetical protein